MARLTDTQLIILSAASQRDDRGVELPTNGKGEAARKAVEHTMSQKLNAAVAVIGIDMGKNSFHVVGLESRRRRRLSGVYPSWHHLLTVVVGDRFAGEWCRQPFRSLHFGEMQGDFHKMQGGGRRNLAKSHQISIAWNGVSLLKRAGKSRENNLCSAGWWRSRLRPDTGDCPLEPRNLQHLHFSECQFGVLGTDSMGLRTGYATPQQSCLALTGAGSRGAGTVRSQAPRACPCRQQDRGKCRELLAIELPELAELLVLEGLDI